MRLINAYTQPNQEKSIGIMSILVTITKKKVLIFKAERKCISIINIYMKIVCTCILDIHSVKVMANVSFWRKIPVKINSCKELLVSDGRVPNEWIRLSLQCIR